MKEEKFQKKLKKIQQKNEIKKQKNKLRKEKNKYRRFSFSKMKTSNKVLAVAVLAIVLFTAACLYIQYKTEVVINDTLITFWYTFWTAEVVSLAGIKVTKVIRNRNSESEFSESNEDFEEEINEVVE